jgi:hypothetical protein
MTSFGKVVSVIQFACSGLASRFSKALSCWGPKRSERESQVYKSDGRGVYVLRCLPVMLDREEVIV